MAIQIPKDFILIISGVSCVGKTTLAYNLLNTLPGFRRVSELDILRSVVRSVVNNIENIVDCNEKNTIQIKYKALYESIENGDFNVLKEQSKILQPCVEEIVRRQQQRKIPTIIEGISVVPSLYFRDGHPIEGFKKNILFINLYISDEYEHRQRRRHRCAEREYERNDSLIKKDIINIRQNKNEQLHQETVALSKRVNNVYSIDVAGLDENAVAKKISNIISFFISLS